jgi:phospholipid/cholesterol/gamma-HCH transport system substrate-binding protein
LGVSRLETKANYTLTGLFVFIFFVGIVWFSLWLSVGFDTKVYDPYLVYMNESVSGLSPESSVKFNGVNVGVVKSIALNYKNPQQVMLLLNIEQGTPITTSTRAQLRSQGITGLSFVGLSTTKAKASPLKVRKGEKYPVILSRPSLLFQLDQTLRDASKDFHSMTLSLKNVLSTENVDNFASLLKSLKDLGQTFDDNKDEIAKSLQDLKVFMDNAALVSKDFPKIMSEASDSLSAFTNASNQTTEFMVTGEASLNEFNQKVLPASASLMDELELLAVNINSLTSELKQNPAMLIRGRTAPKLGPGEK